MPPVPFTRHVAIEWTGEAFVALADGGKASTSLSIPRML